MIHCNSPYETEIQLEIGIETTQPTIPKDPGRLTPLFRNQDHPRAPAKTPWPRPRPCVCSLGEPEGMRRAP